MLLRFLLPRWVLGLRDRVDTLETQMEFVMAEIDDLNTALDAIATDVDAALAHVTELETELKALQDSTPASVDLSGAISKATAIRQRLEGVSTTAASAGGADAQTQPDTTA
jgi:uncharacterized coiled-coil protein SlyX